MKDKKDKYLGILEGIPKPVLVSFGTIFVLGAFLSYMLSSMWSSRSDYSFGYLMPIFALYVLWDRLGKISEYYATPVEQKDGLSFCDIFANAIFFAMFLGGAFLYGFFAVLQILSQGLSASVFVATVGFSFIVFSSAFFASAKNALGQREPLSRRWEFTLLFTFPAFAWIISAPVFGSIESKISLFLLSKVATVVTSVMDFLGFVVERHGNTISFPKGSVGVADACSGIRSLTACLFAGSFLAAVFLDKFWKKAALVLLSMCLAFFNNILRALFLSFWAYENGSESISGFIHDAAGYFVLGMTVVGLFILIPIFMISPVPKDFIESEEEKEEGKNGSEGGED